MPRIHSYVTAPVVPTPAPTFTNVPLASAGTWVSAAFAADGYNFVSGSVFADQAGSIFIEQSENGTNWDVSTNYAVPANDGKGFKEAILLSLVRVRYVNGGVLQTAFRLQFSFR